MYRTRLMYRDGYETVFAFENYGEARDLLIQDCILCGGELLYAEVSFYKAGYHYTIGLIDRRYRTDGRMISLRDLISMRPHKDLCASECYVDEIDAEHGRLRVTAISSETENGWYGLEKFL